jgi:hypothetical protein
MRTLCEAIIAVASLALAQRIAKNGLPSGSGSWLISEETMRYAVLFCAVGLLSGCVSDRNGSFQRPAEPSRTVSIHYSTPRQYRDAARQADAYCAERFGAKAQPTGGYMGSGGDATFRCVNE